MRINFDSSDPFWSLQFHIKYYREKQVERIKAHVEEGNSFGSFSYNEAESNLDTLLIECKTILDNEIARREKIENRKKRFRFWKK